MLLALPEQAELSGLRNHVILDDETTQIAELDGNVFGACAPQTPNGEQRSSDSTIQIPVLHRTKWSDPMKPNTALLENGRHVLTIKLAAETPSPPQQVLEAARDFSDRRADVWPNVRARHLEIHERGENFAEVTEGTWVAGLFWERNRYEWSQPGSVKATVIDSNIFQPGSTWELRATSRDGGSDVEMVLNRAFRGGPKGRIASAVHHTVGRWVWGLFLRSALATVEKRPA